MGSRQNSRRTTLRNSNADDDLDFCFICKKEDHGKGPDNIDWITCDGCEEWFHAVCAKVTFSAGTAAAPYTCKDCTRANRHTAELKNFITESISTSIAEVRKEFAEFQKWTKSEIDGLTNNMTLISTEVATQRVKIKSIAQGGGTALSHRVSSIEDENQRKECLQIVTISGVPVGCNTNDFESVIKIGNLVGVKLDRHDINRCWRARVGDRSKVPLLYCRFADLRPRNLFFHACMKHKDVTLDKISDNAPTTKVYINEMLSLSNFKVWLRAKHYVKFKKLSSVYSVDGRVSVKLPGDVRGRSVLTEDDLLKLVNGNLDEEQQ
jgi:sarcosine oxidase delta subunit